MHERDLHSDVHGHSSAGLKCVVRQQWGANSCTELEICASDTTSLLWQDNAARLLLLGKKIEPAVTVIAVKQPSNQVHGMQYVCMLQSV